MEMRVKVSTADSGVLEGNDGPVGQLLWAACVVEGVAHQGRLEEWAKMPISVTPEKIENFSSKKEGLRWWSDWHSRLQLQQSEFESRGSLQFICKIVVEKNENKQNSSGFGPFLKQLLLSVKA